MSRLNLIDRDALIKHLKQDPLFPMIEQYGITGLIESRPIVDAVEVVHGEWIKDDFVLTSYIPQYQWWYCSECGHILRGFNRDVLTNYCPDCGAKMDLEGEE